MRQTPASLVSDVPMVKVLERVAGYFAFLAALM